MGNSKRRKIPCGKPGCKNFSMRGGSGFCHCHEPSWVERRRQSALKGAASRKKSLTPDKKCIVPDCKNWRLMQTFYCVFHSIIFGPASAKRTCKYGNCLRQTGLDSSGYCYSHSPLQAERRSLQLIKREQKRKENPIEARCRHEGCKIFPGRDGSGFCNMHNPALAENRVMVANLRVKKARLAKVPPERACKIRGCKKWNLPDGSGLCFHHQPAFRLKQRNRILGKKLALGQHHPWLGLKDINEARGLIFYSLIYDKPLLTLRALTKIASLHARGEVYVPPKPAPAPDDPL